MMLAPKLGEYIKVICVESFTFKDVVWGDCSIIEGESYEILVESKYSDEIYCLVRMGMGLCPYKRKYFKTEVEIRDNSLTDILK